MVTSNIITPVDVPLPNGEIAMLAVGIPPKKEDEERLILSILFCYLLETALSIFSLFILLNC